MTSDYDDMPDLESDPCVYISKEKDTPDDELIAAEMAKFKDLFDVMIKSRETYDSIIISELLYNRVIAPRLLALRIPVQRPGIISLTANGPIFRCRGFTVNIINNEVAMSVDVSFGMASCIELKFGRDQNGYSIHPCPMGGIGFKCLFGL
jgi:hypothetical protein